MSSSDDRSLDREELRRRAESGDPVFDPVLLEQWKELDLPLRGELRQRFNERLIQEVGQRRTLDHLSNRLANRISSPIANAIQNEIDDRVKRRLREELLGDDERGGLL